jgi:hypothetical protein
MWCVAELDQEYIRRMEDISAVYEKPLSEQEPVVCVDEKPVVLHQEVRPPLAMRPGRVAQRDGEYQRCGTANVFCGVGPKADSTSPRSHTRKAVVEYFGEKAGSWLWDRFTVHYTPKHGSWLNQAEIEISLFSRQCLGQRRIGDRASLRRQTLAWSRRMNRHHFPICGNLLARRLGPLLTTQSCGHGTSGLSQ